MSGIISYTVYGRITSPDFQRCAEAAAYVNEKYADTFAVTVAQELPREFDARCATWAAAGLLPSATSAASPDAGAAATGADATSGAGVPSDAAAPSQAPPTALVEQHGSGGGAPQLVLSADAFLQHMRAQARYVSAHDSGKDDAAATAYYAAQGAKAWQSFLAARGGQYCWLDVQIAGDAAGSGGRVWVELYASLAPLTCRNFCELCRGTSVAVPTPPGAPAADATAEAPVQEVGYKGTTFFRILKDAWVMAGDVSAGHTGNGGYSCYGRCFPDETFAVRHDAAGVIGMCNDGPHTNGSAFYITRRPMSWMDGKYVAFGRVMDGSAVVDAIHAVEVRHNQSPTAAITIADCGVLDTSEAS